MFPALAEKYPLLFLVLIALTSVGALINSRDPYTASMALKDRTALELRIYTLEWKMGHLEDTVENLANPNHWMDQVEHKLRAFVREIQKEKYGHE